VVIANVLRLESAEGAQELIEIVANIMIPGGDLVILDAWVGDTEESKLDFAVYSLSTR
jgi:hypothetical protein